ncbi:MAG: SBBP repeat-containing protein [Deltaproteobacteria bacterium]|nr:SBBP repeat-containing protein [Deltaproteobacteria bacterium]MBW2070383.1 SBBP repeat-containing protein [Deltaproteobacteria bacterium]
MDGGVWLKGFRVWIFRGFWSVAALAMVLGLGQGSSLAGAARGSSDQGVEVLAAYGRLPLHFIANQGQVDGRVWFYARRGSSTFFFTREGLVLSLAEVAPERNEPAGKPDSQRAAVRLTLVGLAPGVQVQAVEPLPGRVNYFIGNDPKKWRSNIPTYRAVVYREAYPGIDLKFYGNGRQLEYDVIVRPGADPSHVQFCCQGVEGLEVTPAGDLVLALPGGGKLVQKKPMVYQELGGQRQVRGGRFEVQPAGEGYVYGFTLAAYDLHRPLVIDPVLDYSTYLGGGDKDFGQAIAVDGSGCAYVIGQTYSSDFPTYNAYQVDQGDVDVFVTKLSAGGNALVYSTYLGGSSTDDGRAIAVDSSGCAYVTGKTHSSNFPTTLFAFQKDQGSGDAFVTKLKAGGSALTYSTYLGGSSNDFGYGIAVDSSGCAYVTGYTDSTDFPTQNSYQGTIKGSFDAFVTRLTVWGSALEYSTYLGGGNDDRGRAIAVDGSGYAYVTGSTDSTDFPTNNAYQVDQGGRDAFVTKLSTGGSPLVYSTYLGGSDIDEGWGIAVDSSGSAYVTGFTDSSNFPSHNAYQGDQGGRDAFVIKLAAGGSTLAYSTYLGGGNDDLGRAIAVDGSGSAYVTGYTWSSDFPTHNAYQGDQGGLDVFVTRLSTGGNALVYSTYLGGSGGDGGWGIAVDGSGSAYVTGTAESSDFPIHHAYQGELLAGWDAFVTKLRSGSPHMPLDLLLLD